MQVRLFVAELCYHWCGSDVHRGGFPADAAGGRCPQHCGRSLCRSTWTGSVRCTAHPCGSHSLFHRLRIDGSCHPLRAPSPKVTSFIGLPFAWVTSLVGHPLLGCQKKEEREDRKKYFPFSSSVPYILSTFAAVSALSPVRASLIQRQTPRHAKKPDLITHHS